jgi:hypothetical protein
MVEDLNGRLAKIVSRPRPGWGLPFTRIPPVEPCQHHTESCNMSEDGFCDQAQPGIPWWYPMVSPHPLPHETRVVSQP